MVPYHIHSVLMVQVVKPPALWRHQAAWWLTGSLYSGPHPGAEDGPKAYSAAGLRLHEEPVRYWIDHLEDIFIYSTRLVLFGGYVALILGASSVTNFLENKIWLLPISGMSLNKSQWLKVLKRILYSLLYYCNQAGWLFCSFYWQNQVCHLVADEGVATLGTLETW